MKQTTKLMNMVVESREREKCTGKERRGKEKKANEGKGMMIKSSKPCHGEAPILPALLTSHHSLTISHSEGPHRIIKSRNCEEKKNSKWKTRSCNVL